MKKLILTLTAVCLVTSFALAAEKKTTKQAAAPAMAPAAVTPAAPAAVTPAAPAVATPAPENVTLTGTIIDNQCAGTQKPEDLTAFVKTHTKQCALMPGCVASGYSIFSNGTLYKFDAASNAKVAGFLENADSKLQVVVVANKTGNELSLVSIENQQ